MLTVTLGRGLREPVGQRATLGEHDPVRGLAELLQADRGAEAWWSPHVWAENRRATAGWQGAAAVAIDVDYHDATGEHAPMPAPVRAAVLAVVQGFAASLVHMTPRGLRVVFVFAHEVEDAALFERLAQAACRRVAHTLAAAGLLRERDGLTVDAPVALDRARLLWSARTVVDGVTRDEEPLVTRRTPIDPDELLPDERDAGGDDLRVAVQAFRHAHPLEAPRSGGRCPACGHDGCWGLMPDDPARWFCWSSSHEADSGGVGVRGARGWHGDALDLAALVARCSRVELLRREGYLRDRPPAGQDNGRHQSAPPPPPLVPDTLATILTRWRAEGPLIHEPTGIAQLDEMTGGGLVYGSRVFLLGAPDAGKTAILVQIADAYLRRGIAVGLLGVDAEPGDLAQRFLQRRDWSRRACERRDLEDLEQMVRQAEGLPLRLYDSRWTIDAAGADLARYARELGVRAMFGIDSIQTATCTAELAAGSRYESVTARVQAIRALADAHRMLTVGTSEMTRAAYRIADPRERTSDMASGKESGAIEYSARVLLALRSVEGESDLVELRVVKNKYGPSTRDDEPGIHLRLDRAHQVFAQATDYQAPTADAHTDAQAAQRDQRAIADAGRLAVVLAGAPGTTARRLEDLVSAATPGGMGRARYGRARGILGGAIVEQAGPRGALCLHLEGGSVPAAVLAAVPLSDRPQVAAARPRDPSKSATPAPSCPDLPPPAPGAAPALRSGVCAPPPCTGAGAPQPGQVAGDTSDGPGQVDSRGRSIAGSDGGAA